MPRRTRLVFSPAAPDGRAQRHGGLIFALRTDADHATRLLKQNIFNHFNTAANPSGLNARVRHHVHGAYREWGHNILKAMAATLDYERYGLHDRREQFLNVHFYNARELADSVVKKGALLVQPPGPVFYISLDDMIEVKNNHGGEIAFSRLFSADGQQHLGYSARPGKKPLQQQLEDIRLMLKTFKENNGYKLPVVLLEDNVRKAKMLNWVIDLMEQNGIFDHATLAGISTCFCCATKQELAAIQHRGKTVPVTCVVDYRGAQIDVVTPRDVLFDGLVVETASDTSRLPGIFMDVAGLFKIRPEKAESFRRKVHRANMEFCDTLESEFGTKLPLKWFAGAEAISFISGHAPDTPMTKVLASVNAGLRRQAPQSRP